MVVDCHVHIIDAARFPYETSSGGYLPGADEQGRLTSLLDVMAANGVDAALLVQPSCYGRNISAMAAAVAQDARRFAIVSGLPAPPEDAPGLVGMRLNLVTCVHDAGNPALAEALASAVRRGLWVEVQCPAVRLPSYLPMLRDSGAQLVFDHLGYPDPALGTGEKGFRALLELGDEKRHAVKLSGAFRLSRRPFPHDDLTDFAVALVDAFGPEACVWGSDWPFVGRLSRPDYADTLAILAHWVPDATARRIILSDTPRRLFGLGKGAGA